MGSTRPRTTVLMSVVTLLVTILLGCFLVPTQETTQCTCGQKKVLLVLADFPEYQHISSREEITALFFKTVSRYFFDVSYGMVLITGNATDWISLPKLYSQYVSGSLQTGVLNIADDAFHLASESFNFTDFDYVFLVLSFYPSLTGDYVTTLKTPISTKSGTVSGFGVIEEDRDWTGYAHAFALALGLWRLQSVLSGIGSYDLAASGTGDMSSWSKVALGWINSSRIVTAEVPASRIIILDPLEDPSANPLVLQVNLGDGAGEYWVEVRESIGYDRSNLQDYGAVVNYVAPTNSSIQFEKVLQPDVISKAVFIDTAADLSMVALNVTQGRFRLLLGNEQDGRDAQSGVYAMSRAQDAIQFAETQNRFNGLALATTLLANAHILFSLGRFTDADALAVSAETTGNRATVPSDFSQAAQLLESAESLKNSTSYVNSRQAIALVQQANEQLKLAKNAFDLRDFSTARQDAQAAIDMFNRAKQMQLYETILIWLSNIVLIVPVIILALVLRYQLKGL
jgi:hypothetical protein